MKHKACINLVPMFKRLSDSEKEAIAAISKSKYLNKGDLLFTQGSKSQDLMIVHEGVVKLSRYSKDGKEQIIRTLKPGSFTGELSLFLDETHQNFGAALMNCEICVIEGDAFKTLLLKHPDMSIKLLEAVSLRLYETEDSLENLGTLDIESRIAKKLLELADGKSKFVLPYSKKDLASLLGTTSETLSRRLSTLQNDGIIKMEGQRKIEILNKIELELLI